MADSTTLPGPRVPLVDQGGLASMAWFQFFRSLSVAPSDSGSVDTSGFMPITAQALGAQSVSAAGTLASGAVTFRLVGDTSDPGPDTYYGTSTTGAKGWYALPEPPSGGVLPVVTGEILDDQPVFVCGADGSLIFAPASY